MCRVWASGKRSAQVDKFKQSTCRKSSDLWNTLRQQPFDFRLDTALHRPSNYINYACLRFVKDLQVDREELAQRCHRLAQENKDGLGFGVGAWSCNKHTISKESQRTAAYRSCWKWMASWRLAVCLDTQKCEPSLLSLPQCEAALYVTKRELEDATRRENMKIGWCHWQRIPKQQCQEAATSRSWRRPWDGRFRFFAFACEDQALIGS